MEATVKNIWLKTSILLIFSLLILSACENSFSQDEAEKAAISYALDNKREILILDSAKFGQLQPNNFAPEVKQAKFSLPYFTMVLNGKKEFEPKMVHFLFDSTYKVIETKVYDVNADSTEY
jgi:hypothetical protein